MSEAAAGMVTDPSEADAAAAAAAAAGVGTAGVAATTGATAQAAAAAGAAADGNHPGDYIHLQIPRVSAVAIHFPGYINPQSPAAALACLGGEKGISNALGEQVCVGVHPGCVLVFLSQGGGGGGGGLGGSIIRVNNTSRVLRRSLSLPSLVT